MNCIEAAAALRELSRAAARLAMALDSGEPDAACRDEPGWRSPTRDLEPVIVRGEEDLAGALGRGHACLVHGGKGGFVARIVGDEERVRLLAVALAGDVALEAAHAKVHSSATALDAMLERGLAALAENAASAGLATPRDFYVAAMARFPELELRGAKWR